MNSSFEMAFRKTMLILVIFLAYSSVFSQHFNVVACFGAGQASSEIESNVFAFSSQIGASFETKSEIISFSGAIKSEAYNFNGETDLMVFSIPLGCEIYPRINPKPYLGVTLAPSYPTQWLVKRYVFLSGGLTGGIAYDFQKLSAFAQFEYLADLTGYSRSDDYLPASETDKNYLHRYYISLGIKVQL
jgi:hypothetical protein